MNGCFKIHGYPDWYKGLKNYKRQATMRANLASATPETPLDYTDIATPYNEDASPHQTSTDIDLSTMIQREIAKYMKKKTREAMLQLVLHAPTLQVYLREPFLVAT